MEITATTFASFLTVLSYVKVKPGPCASACVQVDNDNYRLYVSKDSDNRYILGIDGEGEYIETDHDILPFDEATRLMAFKPNSLAMTNGEKCIVSIN